MAKLVVELPHEGKRFIVRYPRRETVMKLLEQNAEAVEEMPIVPVAMDKPRIPPEEIKSGPTSSREAGGNAANGGEAIENLSPESLDPSPAPDSSDEQSEEDPAPQDAPQAEPEGESVQAPPPPKKKPVKKSRAKKSR